LAQAITSRAFGALIQQPPSRSATASFAYSISIKGSPSNILDKDGNNLLGHNIPGTSMPVTTYPGEADGATVPVTSAHTRIVNWLMPTSASDPGTDVSVTVSVVSDQPVVVASHFQFNPIGMPNQCSLVPKTVASQTRLRP